MPSPFATNVPFQAGFASQRIAARVGNGPWSSAVTVTRSTPSPVTTTLSVIVAPGRGALRAHLRRHAWSADGDRRLGDLAAGRLGRPHEPGRRDRLAVRVVPGHGQRERAPS